MNVFPTPRSLRRTIANLAAATTAAVAVALTIACPLPAHALTSPDRLTASEVLPSGKSLTSTDASHTLTMRADGDVVLERNGVPLWHTGTTGNPGATLTQNQTGALEVRAAGRTLWSTGVTSVGARTIVKPDGVLYTINTSGAAVWKSAKPGARVADRLPSGGLLLPGETLASPDGKTSLTMGVDGTLALTSADKPAWKAPIQARGGRTQVSPDGDLQLLSQAGSVVWSAGAHSPGSRLVLKDHGRAYLISTAGASVWSTPTPVAQRVPAVVTLPLPGTAAQIAHVTAGSHSTVLAGARQYAPPTTAAATAAANATRVARIEDAALLRYAAEQGSARWLGTNDTAATVGATVRSYASAAAKAGRTPVFVTYAIPNRDCGNYSAGGHPSVAAYNAWVDAIAAGLKGARSVVVVEPDALLHLNRCGNRNERTQMLSRSVAAFTAAGAEVYLDAASSNSFGWSTSNLNDMATRLREAGVANGAGFAVNTSNFQITDHEVAYGKHLAALLGGNTQFVVDTSRNGNGPLAGPDGTVWCNPPGRALGTPPQATNDGAHVANLWIKTVGLSDGTCNGGPAAGTLWEAYLLDLARNAA